MPIVGARPLGVSTSLDTNGNCGCYNPSPAKLVWSNFSLKVT